MSIFLSGSSKQFYLLLIIVFIISCTKNTNLDEVHSQFEYPGSRSESEEQTELYADGHNLRDEQVIQSLKSYFQSRKDYREELETNYGSALWEVAMTDMEDDNPYVILPFAFERDDFLQGILIAYYAKKKSEWRFFMLTKEGIDESKSAKDIPKQSDGKRNELSKELYAGLFVTYESYLFGQVDCELLDILGIENSRNGRDIYCYSYSISYQKCWDVYSGSQTSLQYQYTDCSYVYNFGSYCIPLNESPTAEDDPNNPDSPNYEPPTGSSSPYSSFINKYPNLFTTKEKNFIEDNEWIIPYLEKFIDECNGSGGPGRPDLGVLGNYIREYAKNPREKDFFERYWLGKGNWHLPSTIANEIKTLIYNGTIQSKLIGRVYRNGMYVDQYEGDAYGSSFALALGRFTYYTTVAGSIVEIYDYYNFDPHSASFEGTSFYAAAAAASNTTWGCGLDRSFQNEWKTRAVAAASLFSNARSYHIYWP